MSGLHRRQYQYGPTYQQHFFSLPPEGLSGWLSWLLEGDRLTFPPCSCGLGLALLISVSPSALKASRTWLPVLALTSRQSLTWCVSMNLRTCPSETASLGTSDLLARSMISQSGSRYLLTSSIQNSAISWKLSLSSMAQTSTTALAPRQQAETMERKASEPAVSQICIFTFLPRMSSVLNLKSTPMVDSRFQEQMLSTNRCSRELLPTPELPAIIILNPSSQSFSISYYLYYGRQWVHRYDYLSWMDQSPSSRSSSLCGQLEKSTSPSGWTGVRGRDPRALRRSDRSPDCASWASSARPLRPHSLRIWFCSGWELRKRAALKARTELPVLLASLRIFSSLGVLCWREQRKLRRSQCFCFWLASSQALQMPWRKAYSPSSRQCSCVLICEQISKASWKSLASTASANFSSLLQASSTAADAYPFPTKYPTRFFFFLPSFVFTISCTRGHCFSCTASLNSMSSYSGHSISKTLRVALKARNLRSASLRTRCKGWSSVFNTPVSPLTRAYFQWFLVVQKSRFSRSQKADWMENFSWMVAWIYRSCEAISSTCRPHKATRSRPRTTCRISASGSSAACPSTFPALRSYLRTASRVVRMSWFSSAALKRRSRVILSESLRTCFLSSPSMRWMCISVGEARMATCVLERKQLSMASYCLRTLGKLRQLSFFLMMKVLRPPSSTCTMKTAESNWFTISRLMKVSAFLSLGLYWQSYSFCTFFSMSQSSVFMPCANTSSPAPTSPCGTISLFNSHTSNPASWPAASRLPFLVARRIQQRSVSRFSVCWAVLVSQFQILRVLSSELLMRALDFSSKRTQETLFLWPGMVECSQATSLVYFQSLILRSSEQEAIRFCEGWKQTQLHPRSCPSSTFTHSISTPMKAPRLRDSVSFLRRTEKSHRRTVLSREAETMRFFSGWNCAHMTQWPCPVMMLTQARLWQFQMRMVWSSQAESTQGSQWWKKVDRMQSMCPFSENWHRFCFRSHTFTIPSSPPDTKRGSCG